MRIRQSIDINTEAADAWTLLADGFGDIGDWTTVVDVSSLVGERVDAGAERRCQISGPGSGDGLAVERVTAIDADAMTYTYELVRGPRFIRTARNTVTVIPIGDRRCRISTDGRIQGPWWLAPLTPVISISVRAGARRFLRDLRHRLEHGAARYAVLAAREDRSHRAMPR